MSVQHKHWVAQIFDLAAGNYDCAYFKHFGRRLVDLADLKPGQKVLDVATGRGAVLFPAAEKTNEIIGIDISQKMIDETAKQVPHLTLQVMDAENLAFPDNTFDIVFCGFALFFFPSLEKAMAEFHRVLKPGGKIAVSIWSDALSDLDTWLTTEVKKFNLKGSIFGSSVWTEPELRSALKHFSDIQIIPETLHFTYASAKDWWDSLWSLATRSVFERLTPEQLTNLKSRALAKAREMDIVSEELNVFYGIGTKS